MSVAPSVRRIVAVAGVVLLVVSLGISFAMLRHTAVVTCEPSVIAPIPIYYNNANSAPLVPGAKAPTQFWVLDNPATMLTLRTYHYVAPKGVAAPGKVGLVGPDGTIYGPWQAIGSPSADGVPNTYWTATTDVVLAPGLYTVTDSDPATWSVNAGTDGAGMYLVTGYIK